MPLGMGDEAAKAPVRELADGGVEAVRERAGGRFEQNPAPATPERDGAQLVVVQRSDDRFRDLAASANPGLAACLIQCQVERCDPVGEFADDDVVVMADVRGRADLRHAVRLGLPAHAEAVAQVGRAVVKPRQDVAVQVDHWSRPRAARLVNAVRGVTRPNASREGVVHHCLGICEHLLKVVCPTEALGIDLVDVLCS